jgi:Tfp pilus assembly protein PilX
MTPGVIVQVHHVPIDPRHARQRGASLMFALITLVALSLAAIALVRSVDTGALVIGNLGFKQDATAVADQATRQAIAWLQTQGTTALYSDAQNSGYYAENLDGVDVTGQQSSASTRGLVNWDVDGCSYAASGSYATCTVHPSDKIVINGSTSARYLISRLCLTGGAPDAAGNTCATPLAAGSQTNSTRGTLQYATGGGRLSSSSPLPYYRIVVRVQGVRETVSFTETIVHFD